MPVVQSVTSIADTLLAELELQAPVTRRFLDRLPEERLTWKPHQKSMTAGQLAYHLASVPGGIIRFIEKNPAQVPGAFTFPQPATCRELLSVFDDSIAAVRSLLPKYEDDALTETWRLMAGDRELMSSTRADFLRNIMLSHWYQHRGQFSVYLRMLDVPVPASWGPSADEPPPFNQKA
jgi:uncharacterized damage-inducible protein DinB